MTPLGLAHHHGVDHHYGPRRGSNDSARPNWNPVYYHKADADGHRLQSHGRGSNAVAQYAATVREHIPQPRQRRRTNYLLFFQHVRLDEKLSSSGRTVWKSWSIATARASTTARPWRDLRNGVQGKIDERRFNDVHLQTQGPPGALWRDARPTYFMMCLRQDDATGHATPARYVTFYKGLKNHPPGRRESRAAPTCTRQSFAGDCEGSRCANGSARPASGTR